MARKNKHRRGRRPQKRKSQHQSHRPHTSPFALIPNPPIVAEQRQNLIDEVADWVDLAIEGKAPATLVNEEGDGLIGCGLLRPTAVDAPAVLRGPSLAR